MDESANRRTGAWAKPTMSAANNIAHSEHCEHTLQRVQRVIDKPCHVVLDEGWGDLQSLKR